MRSLVPTLLEELISKDLVLVFACQIFQKSDETKRLSSKKPAMITADDRIMIKSWPRPY